MLVRTHGGDVDKNIVVFAAIHIHSSCYSWLYFYLLLFLLKSIF